MDDTAYFTLWLKCVWGCTATNCEKRDAEEEQIELAKDILAVAESGMDFNMRFITEESKLDASKFICL